MSDTDLIRRGDVIREIDCGGCYGSCANPSSCQLEDVEAIRALSAVDPLADPRVKALVQAVEALRKLHHAVCGETGFAACVRLDSGLAYPWPALDEADEMTRATLAEIEGGKG